MTITLRNTVGRELTYAEVDGNFTDLNNRSLTSAEAAAVAAAVSAGFGQSSMPSTRYWTHALATFQGPNDAAFYDISGQLNDGTFGATQTAAQAWAAAGFASTVEPVGGNAEAVFRFPAIAYDYAAGQSLGIFWKGQITPLGSGIVFCGTTRLNAVKGVQVIVQSTGKLLFGLGNGTTFSYTSDSTGTPFVAGEVHSFMVFIDGVTRKYTFYIDGVLDKNLTTFAAGASIDTLSADPLSLGKAANSNDVNGIATRTQCLVVLKRAAGLGLPSDLVGIAKSLHRQPNKLISDAAW